MRFDKNGIEPLIKMTESGREIGINDANSRNKAGLFLRCIILILLASGAISTSSCGYKVRSSIGKLPDGIQSLGVPIFKNSSHQFKLEQRVTGAVIKELSARTRIPISAKSGDGDCVLMGEIHNVSASPVTFSSETSFASAFLITVQMSVKLVRAKDSAVLWENGSFLYRERYVLNTNVTDFFSEDNPALDRLSQDFASSLVSTLLKR
jgi:hypothetical protein